MISVTFVLLVVKACIVFALHFCGTLKILYYIGLTTK